MLTIVTKINVYIIELILCVVYKYFLQQAFFKKIYNVFKLHVEWGVLYWIHNEQN